MTLGEYIPNSNTKLLLHLNGNSTDSSGNGNNGSDNNISYVDGKFGKCASFNGSSSKIDVGSNIDLRGNFTLGAWIKLTSNLADNRQIIIRDLYGTNYAQYIIYGSNGNKMNAYACSDNVGTSANAVSSSSIALNTWYFVAGTRDGANVKIYINGKLEGTAPWTSAQKVSTDTTTIGCTKNGVGTPSSVFPGLIDEVIIENRAWTPEEVKKYYTYSRGFYSTI